MLVAWLLGLQVGLLASVHIHTELLGPSVGFGVGVREDCIRHRTALGVVCVEPLEWIAWNRGPRFLVLGDTDRVETLRHVSHLVMLGRIWQSDSVNLNTVRWRVAGQGVPLRLVVIQLL